VLLPESDFRKLWAWPTQVRETYWRRAGL